MSELDGESSAATCIGFVNTYRNKDVLKVVQEFGDND